MSNIYTSRDAVDLPAVLEAHALWLRGKGGRRANLRSADLRSADLRGATLVGTTLVGADLRSADLRGANLRSADLRGADLRSADLRGANFICANLEGANLVGTTLVGANLICAKFSGVILHGDIRAISLDRRATRSDGYEFFLWNTDAGWRIKAGCRFLTLDDAWTHWEHTRGGTALGDESLDILTMFQLHIDRVGDAA